MKVVSMFLLYMFAVVSLLSRPTVCVKTVRTHISSAAKANSAIADIVKELKEMAQKSKEDGEAEAKTCSDYSCNTKKVIADKTAEIERAADAIETLEIKIERGTAKKAQLESQVAQLKKDIADNTETQEQTTAMRDKAREVFLAEEASMSSALQQLSDAYVALSNNATSLLQLAQSPNPMLVSVAKQLLAVSKSVHQDFLSPRAQQEEPVLLDVREPEQTDGVLGVLQKTRDTYAQNLQDLQDEEAKQQASYTEAMDKLQTKGKQLKEMKATANEDISQTASDLGEDGKNLKEERAIKDVETNSTITIKEVLAWKSKTCESRKVLRSQEDAAISKAISILNNDESFASFNKIASFMQLTASTGSETIQRRQQVISYLKSQAHLSSSTRLARLAVFMSKEEPENPFDRVMTEIADMKRVIDQEKNTDKKKFETCGKEREKNEALIETLTGDINSQNAKITDDTNALGSVKDKAGLESELDEAKANLAANDAEQKTLTKERAAENQNYQQDVADLQVAQNLVSQAIKVLSTYYDKLKQEDAEATAAAEGTSAEKQYEGQGAAGASVLKLMDTMLTNTKDAETEAHKDEQKAQADFEDSMQAETKVEATLKETITEKMKAIAEKRLALDESSVLLADAEKQKAASEKYLLEIKPGCDFIVSNLDARDANRAAEKESLDNAIKLIKGTPAYKSFESEQ